MANAAAAAPRTEHSPQQISSPAPSSVADFGAADFWSGPDRDRGPSGDTAAGVRYPAAPGTLQLLPGTRAKVTEIKSATRRPGRGPSHTPGAVPGPPAPPPAPPGPRGAAQTALARCPPCRFRAPRRRERGVPSSGTTGAALPESRARPPPCAPLRARRTALPLRSAGPAACAGTHAYEGGEPSPAAQEPRGKRPGSSAGPGQPLTLPSLLFRSRFSRSRLCPVPPPSPGAASAAGGAHARRDARHSRTVRAHVATSLRRCVASPPPAPVTGEVAAAAAGLRVSEGAEGGERGRAQRRILSCRPAGPGAGESRRNRGLERARAARACPAQRARPAPRLGGREGPRAGPGVPEQRLPAPPVPRPGSLPCPGEGDPAGEGPSALSSRYGSGRGESRPCRGSRPLGRLRAPWAGSVPRGFPPRNGGLSAATPREFSCGLCVLWEPLPVHSRLASGPADRVLYFCCCLTIKKWCSLFFEVVEGGKRWISTVKKNSCNQILTVFKDSHCAVTGKMRFPLSPLHCKL